MNRKILGWAMAALMAAPVAAGAEDLALIVANEYYDARSQVQGSTSIVGLQNRFRQAGYAVHVVQDTLAPVKANDANGLWQRLNNADRLVIVLSGHMVHTAGENYLLHTNTGALSPLTLGQSGLAVGPYMALAAERQGDALVVLADDNSFQSHGGGIGDGYVVPQVPQGVTWISGTPRDVARFITQELLRPNQSVANAAKRAPTTVQVAGYIPRSQSFVRGGGGNPNPNPGLSPERAFWRDVKQLNTADGYAEYLRRYPNGRFVEEARKREAELRLTPADRARLVEEGLNLSRDQRRAVQRQLTLLGFDTQGVDGWFGRNTRTALISWQKQIGLPPHGYLTANQVIRLENAAKVRAEELRREAEQRRLEEERQDRIYWNRTGANGSEEGMRTYLQKYPDGLFAASAKQQLQAIERERRRQAEAEERQAWDRAVLEGTANSYAAYINAYPQGLFVQEARNRYNALQHPETPRDIVEHAQAEERRIGLNGFTRNLIEAQLRSLNLNPGRVDGKFTQETRRALRNYQRANNLPVTGFVTRDTVVRLLASAVD